MSEIICPNPLQYRPTDPHMGLWTWDREPDEHGIYLLGEPLLKPDAVASVRHSPNGFWNAQLAGSALLWLDDASEETANAALEITAVRFQSGREAAERMERAVAALAIDCGVAPNPECVAAVFIYGKRRPSVHILRDIEAMARQQMPEIHPTGSLAVLDGDDDNLSVNPVRQARLLQFMFIMSKGHWPDIAETIAKLSALDVNVASHKLLQVSDREFPPGL